MISLSIHYLWTLCYNLDLMCYNLDLRNYFLVNSQLILMPPFWKHIVIYYYHIQQWNMRTLSICLYANIYVYNTNKTDMLYIW